MDTCGNCTNILQLHFQLPQPSASFSTASTHLKHIHAACTSEVTVFKCEAQLVTVLIKILNFKYCEQTTAPTKLATICAWATCSHFPFNLQKESAAQQHKILICSTGQFILNSYIILQVHRMVNDQPKENVKMLQRTSLLAQLAFTKEKQNTEE